MADYRVTVAYDPASNKFTFTPERCHVKGPEDNVDIRFEKDEGKKGGGDWEFATGAEECIRFKDGDPPGFQKVECRADRIRIKEKNTLADPDGPEEVYSYQVQVLNRRTNQLVWSPDPDIVNDPPGN